MKLKFRHIASVLFTGLLLATPALRAANIDVDGDFRLRWYSDRFSEALDDRGDENYMRYRSRLRARAQVNRNSTFYAEFTTWTENNPVTPVRNIAGSGKMEYGLSQLFAELVQPNVLCFDVFRARVGRQQFPIGEGLSQGESGYFFDKFDGVRFDMSRGPYVLSLFGAITNQNISESGLYPDPGSDQLYVTRLSRSIGSNHTVMGYYIYNKLRGDFNDSYVWGGGFNGNQMANHLQYFGEIAWQGFNQIDGLPEKGGKGYMGGIGYRWTMGPFSSIKVETRYAAYQGDDASTEKIEIFSPLYPSFTWGSRRGYVDGSIGGDYPLNGRNPEGSRIWYTRFYVVPNAIPKLRVQVQYINIGEYVDNDDYNSMDDEMSILAFYQFTKQTRLQVRYAHNYPNDDDWDQNDNGAVTLMEDRITQDRFMTEILVEF